MSEQVTAPHRSDGRSVGRSIDVAVNLLWCVPGEVGGSEEYLVRQLLGLAAHRPGVHGGPALGAPDEFVPTIYCLASFADAHPELGDRFELVAAPIAGTRRSRRVLSEHTWLARRTRSADIVHHGGGTAPRVGGDPVVLTVHDLQYETYPQYVAPAKLRYLRAMMPRSVARASVIAVPTEYVRSTVVDRFDVDADRVVVVPHGIDTTVAGGTDAAADTHATHDAGETPTDVDVPLPTDLRRRYGLGDGPIIVFPAITHPHKGHEFLLEVMAQHWTDPDLRLVLLGGKGAADGAVHAAIERHRLQDRVVRPGRVPDTHRDGLIRLADALVFPSRYEGFGAPVLEAMALGTPVVCSDQPALFEVVGDAGLVLPLDAEAWKGALDYAVTHGPAMRTAGRQRAASFTAASSGAAIASAYRLAAARAT